MTQNGHTIPIPITPPKALNHTGLYACWTRVSQCQPRLNCFSCKHMPATRHNRRSGFKWLLHNATHISCDNRSLNTDIGHMWGQRLDSDLRLGLEYWHGQGCHRMKVCPLGTDGLFNIFYRTPVLVNSRHTNIMCLILFWDKSHREPILLNRDQTQDVRE